MEAGINDRFFFWEFETNMEYKKLDYNSKAGITNGNIVKKQCMAMRKLKTVSSIKKHSTFQKAENFLTLFCKSIDARCSRYSKYGTREKK